MWVSYLKKNVTVDEKLLKVPHEICICPSQVLSMQYQFIHFNMVMICVLSCNCAMRGDLLPSLKPPLSVFAVVAHSETHCQ